MVCATRSIVFLLLFLALASSALAETAAPPPDPISDAERLMKAKKHKEAIPVLAEVAASNHESAPQALKMMGECYKVRKNWAKAIECYERLLAEHPDSVAPDQEIRTWILDCYLADSDVENFNKMRSELLKGNRKQVFQVHYVTGRRYVWMHKHSKAIPELEKAVANARLLLSEDPDELDANKRLLDCYMTKEWDKARALAERLARDYPDEGYQWHYANGRVYFGQGEYSQAIESLVSAVELTPRHDTSLNKLLLECYWRTGEDDRAISHSQRLCDDYPKEPAWRWELARFYLFRDEYDEASSLFKEVIASSNKQWEIRSSQIYLGECLFKRGRGQEALEGIEHYYKERPELWDERLLVQSAVLFYADKFRDSLAAAEELISQSAAGRHSSLVTTAKETMLKARHELGDWREAAMILEELATQAKDTRRMCQAGHYYFRAEDYVGAVRVYESILSSDSLPNDGLRLIRYNLAVCYWNLRLKEKAISLAEKVAKEHSGTDEAFKATAVLHDWLGQE